MSIPNPKPDKAERLLNNRRRLAKARVDAALTVGMRLCILCSNAEQLQDVLTELRERKAPSWITARVPETRRLTVNGSDRQAGRPPKDRGITDA